MLSDLIKPFPAADIEWRAGATNQDKTRALAMAYLTSRAVMNRLDDVVGPENWRDEYSAGPQGGIMCGISIYTENGWVTKYDVGENSDFEPVKGGFADAFKRAAVKWGIGRYLYNLDAVWHECEVRGKSVVLKGAPPLPKWALPAAVQQAPQPDRKPAPQAEPATMTLAEARDMLNSKGQRYGDIDTATLEGMEHGINAGMKKPGADIALYKSKLQAINLILADREAADEAARQAENE